MKGKRFAALALALTMTLSLLVVPASAVTFTDLANHWAKSDVEDLATRGIVNGYTDGTFKPDNKMTVCEALLFCSRAAGVEAGVKDRIAAARAEELKTLLPTDMYPWAYKEMAVCLETGIISATELKALTDGGNISKSVTRETLAMYLVRAMQLAPLAESLSSYGMTFADTASIAPALQPYVYLLNMYGIVKGNQANSFMPQGALTRGEMATMLRRGIDEMTKRGIVAELPAYTSYNWVGGTIAASTVGDKGLILLTLTSELSGTRSVSLPATVKVYENNMLATTTALKVGQYARVNLDSKGTATEVRLGGAVTAYSGTVSGVTQSAVTLSINGTSKKLVIDRFTEVRVGKTTGDRTLIDVEAGYTTAACKVDEQGHLASLQLTGGTRQETGLITAVEAANGGAQTLQVAGFNGVTQRYTLPAGSGVTVNGLVGTVNTSYISYYVSMRVSNDDGNQIVTAAIDTVTRYEQGSVKTISYSKTPNTISVSNLASGKSTVYNVTEGAQILYNGATIALSKLENGSFVTLRITGGEVSLVDAYPGSTTTEGTISSITYGTPTVVDVKKADDTVVTYNLDLAALPEIYRSGQKSSIDKIRTGDTAVVTVRYNKVERIDTTPQTANFTGTIDRIMLETTGITMDVTLSNGATATYVVSEGVSVIQDGKAISVYNLKPKYKVALVVSGDQVTSIEVDKSAESSGQVKGTVLVVNSKEKTILLQPGESAAPITVDVSAANFIESSGATYYFSGLKTGNAVQVYGGYEGATFKATIVIRL